MIGDNPPTCGVVIEKAEGQTEEKVCGEKATVMLSITDPNEPTRVTAIVLLCAKHDAAMELGKTLILQGENGEHIAINMRNVQGE